MAYSPSTIHNVVFTIPRTASNLVTQLLNLPAQPNISRHSRDGYFFLPALGCRYELDAFNQTPEHWSEHDRHRMHEALQKSFDAWKFCVDEADNKSQSTFIKEHVNWMIALEEELRYLHDNKDVNEAIVRNPTCIPNSFLLDKVRSTFLIRHPALTFPSLFRTIIDNEGLDELEKVSTGNVIRWEATYHWHISLFKFLVASSSYPWQSHDPDIQYPIIVDASDLSNPELVRKYAAAVGLDPQLVRFTWNESSPEEREKMSKIEVRMKDTLLKSQGVVVDKLQEVMSLDLDKERTKWENEFGNVLGERLARLVNDAMADYTWLWERRLKV